MVIQLNFKLVSWGILIKFRSSPSEVLLGKGVLKICSKFTGEHPCRSAISIKLQQLYWNCTLAWMFSCKFAAYFQNTFSQQHLWRAASKSWSLFWGQIGWVGGSDWNIFSNLLDICSVCSKLGPQSKIKYKFCIISNINFEKMLTLLLMSSFSTGYIKQSVRRRANVNLRQ